MKRRPALASLLVLPLLALGGCGGDDPAAPKPAAPSPLATATALNTPLPSGWPTTLQLPVGSTVTSTSDAAGRLAVDFESQELGTDIAAFLEKELTTAGFQKKSTGTQDDTITVAFTGTGRTATLTLVETGGTTSGTVTILAEPAGGS